MAHAATVLPFRPTLPRSAKLSARHKAGVARIRALAPLLAQHNADGVPAIEQAMRILIGPAAETVPAPRRIGFLEIRGDMLVLKHR
jgi:hypothetical protein